MNSRRYLLSFGNVQTVVPNEVGIADTGFGTSVLNSNHMNITNTNGQSGHFNALGMEATDEIDNKGI